MLAITSFLMIVASLAYVVESDQSVPALLWSPERSMSELPDPSGMDALSSDNFLTSYLTPLTSSESESAVVFLQDKLHVDDFTRFADVYSLDSSGGAFKNIKSLLEDHFSLELPQVADPHAAVEKLISSFSGDVHTANSAEEVENLDLTAGKKFLLIIHLSPVRGKADKETALQKNDATVGDIARHLKKRSIKYTALFTGKSAGDGMAEEVESHSNRHLLAEQDLSEANYNGTFMNVSNGEIFVFLRSVYVCLRTTAEAETSFCPTNFTLIPDENTANKSIKVNKTAVIELEFPHVSPANKTDTYTIRIVTDAWRKGDRWNMSRIALYVTKSGAENDTLNNATLTHNDIDLTVPILYSFHCTEMRLNVDFVHNKDLKEFKDSYVVLRGYQIQPFNIQQNRFFNAQDCVGYFTRGIWMGLFSSAFLLVILLFGTLMVLDLSIMDRYDDPKGKTITVAQPSE